MATEDQINIGRRGGGRILLAHRALLALVSGVLGVTGSGAITAGTGGTSGTFPLAFTGGVLATGGYGAAGRFVVTAGALTAIIIDAPGQYSTAPTAFSFAASAGLTGAAATLSSGQISSMSFATSALNGQYNFPPASYVDAFTAFVATAFTGGATAINVTVGTAVNDASYVAAVNIAAAGEFALAKVVAGLAALRNLPPGTNLVVTIVATGVTTAVGSAEVSIKYGPVNP